MQVIQEPLKEFTKGCYFVKDGESFLILNKNLPEAEKSQLKAEYANS